VWWRKWARRSPAKQVPPLRIAIDEANRNAPVGMTDFGEVSLGLVSLGFGSLGGLGS